ncbi:MAG: pyruvate kinase [Synergistaceae bacterium]|jgi:pyruvate kinase|nr:pyruvate kinase [Synergistaceae bacterium]MCK9436427.1 pyruvate kinase [Synergistaceae bacterium]MDD2350793.1 pyruvate kinase [Synergistaceae bacterium]MDD3319162.1 pyruvate kinase [Synergistaceae bacterium]MDD3672565.1 pyruvate kinase [Synergistaceae bacterium]
MKRLERKVKIICTMGPACWDEETISELVVSGMNVARLNFSHGDYASHTRTIDNVRKVEERLRRPVATLLDTKGPEIRTGMLPNHEKIQLESGKEFYLFFEAVEGNADGVHVDYPDLYKEVSVGQEIFIDDGSLLLSVEALDPAAIKCRVLVGGELGEKKGVNVPGANLSVPTLTDKDISDIRWGVEHKVDYIAVSFVRTKEDILGVRKVLEEHLGESKIIAKIETRQSVENIDEILAVVDGIMVARGDLGVEMPTEDVPMVQKEIIEKCRSQGKPAIVATQMLDSMIRNPKPTRAEASDVANAVIDGADAVMLSGETASGRYPVASVKIMNKILMRTEENLREWQRTPKIFFNCGEVADAVSRAARDISETVCAAAILSLTRSGATARMVSKYRPDCPVIALTPSFSTWRELALVWGVYPLICPFTTDVEESVSNSLSIVQEEGLIKGGDNVVFTSGIPLGIPGSTNLVQVYTVGEIIGKGLSLIKRKVRGVVCKAENYEEANEKVTPGSILVVRKTDKDFIPSMERSAGVISEEEGFSCHTAVASLDMGLPGIVGVSGIFDTVEDGMLITLDGIRGVVYLGRSQ